MEEPGRLQSMGSLRVGHDWGTSLSLFTFMHWRRKWQPTPVFLPGEPRDGGAWWAAIYGVPQRRTWLKRLSSSSSSHGVLCAQCTPPPLCLGVSTALLASESGQQCGLGQLSLLMPQLVRLTQEYKGPKPGHSEFLPQGNREKVYFPDWGVQLTVALLLARCRKTYLQERMTRKTSKNERKQKWCYGS